MKAMAHHNVDLTTTNLIGMILTIFATIFAKITASDLAAIMAIILAAINMVIAWPKLRLRLQEIFKKKNKLP